MADLLWVSFVQERVAFIQKWHILDQKKIPRKLAYSNIRVTLYLSSFWKFKVWIDLNDITAIWGGSIILWRQYKILTLIYVAMQRLWAKPAKNCEQPLYWNSLLIPRPLTKALVRKSQSFFSILPRPLAFYWSCLQWCTVLMFCN